MCCYPSGIGQAAVCHADTVVLGAQAGLRSGGFGVLWEHRASQGDWCGRNLGVVMTPCGSLIDERGGGGGWENSWAGSRDLRFPQSRWAYRTSAGINLDPGRRFPSLADNHHGRRWCRIRASGLVAAKFDAAAGELSPACSAGRGVLGLRQRTGHELDAAMLVRASSSPCNAAPTGWRGARSPPVTTAGENTSSLDYAWASANVWAPVRQRSSMTENARGGVRADHPLSFRTEQRQSAGDGLAGTARRAAQPLLPAAQLCVREQLVHHLIPVISAYCSGVTGGVKTGAVRLQIKVERHGLPHGRASPRIGCGR